MSKKIRIKKVTVKKLFGIYTYDLIPLADSNFMILYGDNGSGKTMILSCLYHIFNPEEKGGHRTAIGNVPFLEFNVQLSNNDSIDLCRLKYNEKKYSITFPYHSKRIKYIWNPDKSIKDSDDNYSRYCEYLRDLNLNTLFLSANRQIYDDKDEMPIRYRRAHQLQFFDEQEEFDRYRDKGNLTLLQVIDNFQRWMHQKMIALTNEGNKSIGEHYLNIINNLTKRNPKVEKSTTVKERIKQIENNNEKFTKFGLSIELFSRQFQKTISGLSSKDWTRVEPILDSYISSLELRLQALSSLQDKLQKFEDYLSKFFKDKKIEITSIKGIRIRSLYDDELEPNQLSSGEKQMLYLLCRIMTSSNDSSIIIIDEPEISLNIKWQREFLNVLNAIIGDGNSQVIIATHSIEMINPFRSSVVKLISNE